jgi:hypothetical protein
VAASELLQYIMHRPGKVGRFVDLKGAIRCLGAVEFNE